MGSNGDAEVRAKVTYNRILKKLPKDKQHLLEEPIAAGDGLTDQTYADWIIDKGQRLFLILDDLGCPERIFDVVDKFIEDTDLPLRREDVAKLGLTHCTQEGKFYHRQFAYVAEKLGQASVEQQAKYRSPVSVSSRTKGTTETADCVYVGEWELARWRIPLNGNSPQDRNNFTMHYRTLQDLRHLHLVHIFATSLQKDNGAVLLAPYEMSLRSFLKEQSKDFKQKTKVAQLDLLLQWIRCLIGVTAYLHEQGLSHQAIRPSNIFVTADSNILLGPHAGPLTPTEECPSIAKNAYLAPEQWASRSLPVDQAKKRLSLHRRSRSVPRLAHSRRPSHASFRTLPPHETLAFTTPAARNRQHSSDAGLSPHLPVSRYLKESKRVSASCTDSSKPLPPSPQQTPTSLHIAQQYSPASGHRRRASFTSSTSSLTSLQSDIFSLSAVIIEILSLFACIARSSAKFSTGFLHSHLEKNRGASRRGEEPSFQSSLPQVSTWLDSLAEMPAPSSRKKLPRLLIGMGGSRSNSNDLDPSHYVGVLPSLIKLVRRGIERNPDLRYSAPEMGSRADELVHIWGISFACACSEPVPPKLPFTPHTPIPAVSPMSTRRETRVIHDDDVDLPSPLEPPGARSITRLGNTLPPVPTIPPSLRPGIPKTTCDGSSPTFTVTPLMRAANAEPTLARCPYATEWAEFDLETDGLLDRSSLVSSPSDTHLPQFPDSGGSTMAVPILCSRLNVILRLAASMPAAHLKESDTSPPNFEPAEPLSVPTATPTISPQLHAKGVQQLQPHSQLQALGLPPAENDLPSCSSDSVASSAEDACWLPPTPTSTLFHPTVYAMAAAAWDEDTMDSSSVDPLSLAAVERKDSDVPISPNSVLLPANSVHAFDNEGVFLPIYLPPSDSQESQDPFRLPFFSRSAPAVVNDASSSVYSDDDVLSIYSDDEQSVIIALDAYVLPRPLRSSGQSAGSINSLRHISSDHRDRSAKSSSLRRSRTWANMGTGLGLKVGMGVGEDIGRARFRGRWEERLARKGTVTAVKPLAHREGGLPASGPVTGPAALTEIRGQPDSPTIAVLPANQGLVYDETCGEREISERRKSRWWGYG
ncbi:MAG: hypothetical protein LQ340_002619 [Diploschistes diacapsis]|nr:MAG: hypothetical protein LQ340_002619 [Diploschistes diacapsis]